MLTGVCWKKLALVGGTNWHLAPTAFYGDCQLKSALVGRCVFVCVLCIRLTTQHCSIREHLTPCVLTDEKPVHKAKPSVPPPVGKKPSKCTDPALLAQTDDDKANQGHVDLGRSSLVSLVQVDHLVYVDH